MRVGVKVTEGTRTRVQNYEGVGISRKGGDKLAASFTVRKIPSARVWSVCSPLLSEYRKHHGRSPRYAKLYYLRERRGKSARIVEKTNYRPKAQKAAD